MRLIDADELIKGRVENDPVRIAAMCAPTVCDNVVVEKQKPKKPDYEGDGCDDKGELVYDTWICPCCGKRYEVDYDDYEHCPKCGQAIDWREE